MPDTACQEVAGGANGEMVGVPSEQYKFTDCTHYSNGSIKYISNDTELKAHSE